MRFEPGSALLAILLIAKYNNPAGSPPITLMPLKISCLLVALFLAGCAAGPNKVVNPHSGAVLSPTRMVRTTAYTHTERDHIRYGRMSASGTRLVTGHIRSAAADWSKFPVGTKFRIKQTGQVYVVDDYGSALVGTSTLDLYVPTRGEMNRWGARVVEIDIIKWGSPAISAKLLRGRTRARHVRVMLEGLQKQI